MSESPCSVVIRLGLESDLTAVMDMVRAVIPLMISVGNHQWSHDYPTSCHFLQDVKLQQLWVATLNDVVVGAGALTTEQPDEYADAGWDLSETCIVPHRLVVSPNYQGKGIAAAIMRKGEELAKERGYKYVRVDTNILNTATNKLFPRLGYKHVAVIGLKMRPGQEFSCYEKLVAQE